MTPFVNVLWASGIQMLGTSSGASETDGTSHDVALPAGTAVGDVNVIIYRISHDTVSADPPTNITIPTGWTLVASHGNITRVVTRKYQSGDPTTVTFTTDNSRKHAYTVHRWGNAHGDVEVSSFANAPGHNTVTPSWGNAENGYIASVTSRGWDYTFVAPTGYGSQVGAASATGGSSTSNCSAASAHRILESSSEQPGDWDITGSLNQTYTVVIAVRPA